MKSNKSESEQKIRCIIYCRVSTAKQKREGLSLSAQKDLCTKYAEDEGFNAIRIFSEDESASISERKKFNEMLAWMRGEKIHHLILEKIDRFHRNMKGESIIKDNKLTVHFIKNGMTLNWKNSNASDKLIFRVLSVIAAYEKDNTGEKGQEGMIQRAERGEFPGFAPLGYKNNKLKKTVEIDEDRAPLMKKLFELAATRKYSVIELTEMMKNMGLKSKCKGKYVHKSMIQYYLRDPFYYGYFRWKDIDGNNVPRSNRGIKNDREPTYKALITKELFDEVQDYLSGKYIQRKRGKDFQFKGLITCGLCGCSVVGETKTKLMKQTGKKKSFTYYHCTQGRGKCALPWFTEKEIEDAFTLAIKSLYIDPQADEYIRNKLNEGWQNEKYNTKATLQNLRSEKTKLESKLSLLYDDKCTSDIPEDFFRKEFARTTDRLEEIRTEERIMEEDNEQSIEEGAKTLDLVKDFKNRYLSSKGVKRKEINQLLFRTIFAGECKFPIADLQPLKFVWNEPFTTLAEIGFIQRLDEVDVQPLPNFEKKHTWPDSNQRLTD